MFVRPGTLGAGQTPSKQGYALAAANWSNQTIWTGDNLPIMRGMNSGSVDLIYLDPPFNSKTNYAAPIGSEAAGAEFKDTWTLQDVDIAWLDLIEAKYPALNKVIHAAMNPSDKSYLIYMAVRLLEMHRILKDTGSIYLHCDPTMSHYLKLAMDAMFGRKQFRNEIVWRKYGGRKNNAKKKFTTQNDVILFYGASDKTLFSPVFEPLSESALKEYKHVDENGRRYRMARRGKGYESAGGLRRIYLDKSPGSAIGNLWSEKGLQLAQSSRERVGYPTQKPLALLKRIIMASCPDEGKVLDPFCGCATACIAAEIVGRQWVGIDISPKAAELVQLRMEKELGLFFDGVNRTDIPQRTDIEPLKRYNHPDNKRKLYGEQGGNCNGCGDHFKSQNLTVDHIIPKSKGGTDHLVNLQLLCGHCNSVKGNRGQEYLIAKLAA